MSNEAGGIKSRDDVMSAIHSHIDQRARELSSASLRDRFADFIYARERFKATNTHDDYATMNESKDDLVLSFIVEIEALRDI